MVVWPRTKGCPPRFCSDATKRRRRPSSASDTLCSASLCFSLCSAPTLHLAPPGCCAAGAKGKASRWFRVQFGANEDCLHREQAGWWFNSGYLDGMPWVQRKMCDQGCTIMMCHSDFDCFNFGPWCSSRSWGHLFSRTKFIVSFDLTFTFWRSEISLFFKCFLFFRRPSSCLKPAKKRSKN